VIIHRAVLGSIERMTAILLEHFKGKLPMWLSPRQIMVVPISEAFLPYAKYVRDQLHYAGLHAEVDKSNATLSKKVREAQLEGWCYQAIVGEKEEASWSINLRTRESAKPLGSFVLDAALEKFKIESMPTSMKLNEIQPWKGMGPGSFAPPARETQAASASGAKETPAASASGAKESPGLKRQGSLQLRKQLSRAFADISVDDDLETWLEDHPYLGGFVPTKRDAELFDQMECAGQLPATPCLQRWYAAMEGTSKAIRSSWKPA
jgi:hypothetical protein